MFFDDGIRQIVGIARLPAYQAEHQLMVALKQPGRIHQVRGFHRIQNVRYGHGCRQQPCWAGSDLEFRLLPALHNHRGYAGFAIQTRSDVIGCHLPQSILRHRI